VQQRHQQQQKTGGCECHALHATLCVDASSTDPGHALHQGHEPDEPTHVAHEGDHSRWPAVCKVVVASIVVVAWLSYGQARAATPVTPPSQGVGELTVLWAALLGALQGASEFLPVSSSGHLALAQAWLGIDPATAGHRFSITVHAGTLLAVVWIFRTDVRAILRAAVRPTVSSPERTMLLMMVVASVPLGVVLLPGVEALVVTMEGEVRWVGVALMTTATVLFFAFRGQHAVAPASSQDPPSSRQAILIGVAQLCAVLPGISRSGSTIAAGLAVGLDRGAAARFSFLISIPAITAASLKEGLEVAMATTEPIDPLPYVAGFITSLAVGLVSLRGLLYLVNRGRIGVFVLYLLGIGAIAVAVG
jgi:undecaprenyl-diphosphatase